MRDALLLIALCACGGPRRDAEDRHRAATGCGFERWAIKTASDANASGIAQARVAGTIAALSALPAHFDDPSDRIAPLEDVVWQLTDVALVQYRRESDGDYHLVLSDGTRTMIAEIPDPACVAPDSPLLAQMARAREQFDARHGPVLAVPSTVSETVTVAGVGFYDSPHEQTGAAPNEVELHPVVAICFGSLCAGPPPGELAPAHAGCASADAAQWWLALLPLRRRRRAARTRRRA